ncbi:MAG TPA: hypothetical protein PK264_18945 [Hyphomicrobiaceae bacterium]|nr:hypothetical protein [Hyphomicrobiaceae bacterium]
MSATDAKPASAVDVMTRYANHLNVALVQVISDHMPPETAARQVRDASRTVAVGVIAHILGRIIAGADDHDKKGGRTALTKLARETLDDKITKTERRS